MNEIVAAADLLSWKPLISALLLPPVPWLVLAMLAWWLRKRPIGTVMLSLALLGLWLSHCEAVGVLLEARLKINPVLSTARIAELERSLAARKPVVLVLGGGADALAPEYGEAHLTSMSMGRLHYGLWLAKRLHAPAMFSGGIGHGQIDGNAEASVAGRIASRDYQQPLRWQEDKSRDTRENARLSLTMLRSEGITDLLLVTDGFHMPRAMRAFEQEAERAGFTAKIVAAPMGLAVQITSPVRRWMPSIGGYRRVIHALHEMIGLLAGA